MTQPFGYNIHLRYVKDIGKLYERMAATRPAVCVVMVDAKTRPDQEDQTPYIQQFAARYPDTLIVARVKHDHDAGFHTPPQNDPQNRPYIASPNDFLNEWGHLGRNNMTLYALNEPLANEETTDADVERLMLWCVTTITEAVRRGISLTVGNFGMGQPALNKALTEWDTRFDPLLILLSKYRDTIFLGLHEYGPDEPFAWGRINFMLKRCEELKIPPPRVVITEFGVDATASTRNGYKAREWSGDYYMRRLIDVYNRIYMPLIDKGIVKGTCLFSYGNSGGWQSFDVENDAAFFETLDTALKAGSFKSKPVEIPTPTPTPQPESWATGVAVAVLTGAVIRFQPSVSSKELATVRNMDIVQYDRNYAVDGWYKIRKGDVTGYASKQFLTNIILGELPAPNPEQPIPIPPAPHPDTIIKQRISELWIERRKLEAQKLAIEAALDNVESQLDDLLAA